MQIVLCAIILCRKASIPIESKNIYANCLVHVNETYANPGHMDVYRNGKDADAYMPLSSHMFKQDG